MIKKKTNMVAVNRMPDTLIIHADDNSQPVTTNSGKYFVRTSSTGTRNSK